MSTNYAGFWLRFVAYIIDAVLIYVVQSFVFIPLFAMFGFSFAAQMGNPEAMTEAEAIGMIGPLMGMMGATMILGIVISIAYWSIMEASRLQATVGKLALGLIVTDAHGNRLNVGQAIVRNLSKILSSMILCIGYIMAGFTDKKQGLHDMIANTLVVKKASAIAGV